MENLDFKAKGIARNWLCLSFLFWFWCLAKTLSDTTVGLYKKRKKKKEKTNFDIVEKKSANVCLQGSIYRYDANMM